VKLIGEEASEYSFFVLREGAATVSIDGAEVRTLGAAWRRHVARLAPGTLSTWRSRSSTAPSEAGTTDGLRVSRPS